MTATPGKYGLFYMDRVEAFLIITNWHIMWFLMGGLTGIVENSAYPGFTLPEKLRQYFHYLRAKHEVLDQILNYLYTDMDNQLPPASYLIVLVTGLFGM